MPEAASTETFVIGVDIGGTKVAAGLVHRATGEITRQTRLPMIAHRDAAAGLTAVTSTIDLLLKSEPSALGAITGIGICAPGPLDPQTGVILNPPNVPCWRNFPLAAEISGIYNLPVKVDNDANAAALAETLWGAGRGYRIVFYATIGTGIGTGIVFDGRIYHGRTGAAAEGGHMTIDYRGVLCACGKHGCIEALAAGPAIARRARARLDGGNGGGSAILQLAGGNIEAITTEIVGQAFAAGDAEAREVLDQTVEIIAIWLGNIVDLLDPEVIILGGGGAALLKPLFPTLRERLPGCCLNPRSREIPLVAACYGVDAGIAGGAALCSDALVVT